MVFVDYRDKNSLCKCRDLKWVAICSYKASERASAILDAKKRIFIGRLMEEVVDSIRQNFVEFIGQVSSQQSDKILWYSSRMASKSVQTSMFHQYVYLKLLERIARSNQELILVVTDNKELVYNANKVFGNRIKIISMKQSIAGKPYSSLSGYLKILRYCLFLTAAKFFKKRKIDTYDVFLHSWIDPRVFNKLPRYNDPYFVDLEEVLSKDGFRVARLTTMRVTLKNMLKLNSHFANILYPMAYVNFSDFIKNAFKKINLSVQGSQLLSINDSGILNKLLESEVLKENSAKVHLEYLTAYYGYRNLSKMIKRESVLIYPFENQPYEKMFNLAFADFKKIAYQHSTIPYNWLNYRVTDGDDWPSRPKVILTIGKKWSSFLRQYYSSSIIEEVGAMRFSYLFKEGRGRNPNNQKKNILVALTMLPNISIPLQRQLLGLLNENDLSGYSIKIKPHPYLPKYACLEKSFLGHKNCKFTNENINELLKDCSLLVTSNSSVSFESVFLGIKTLYFIPEVPSEGLEYYLRDSLFLAYTENFREKFQEALRSTNYPEVNIEEFFSQPNYKTFLSHIRKR